MGRIIGGWIDYEERICMINVSFESSNLVLYGLSFGGCYLWWLIEG